MKDWEILIAKDMVNYHLKDAQFCRRWIIWVIEELSKDASLVRDTARKEEGESRK